MAHFLLEIRGYDALGQVMVSAIVKDADTDSSSPDHHFHTSTSFPGVGESDHREWLRDALIGLLESL